MMTLTDRRGQPVTAENAVAVQHLDAAIDAFLGHRAATPQHLAAAFQADPDLPLAHALKGFFSLLLGRAELHGTARTACQTAQTNLAARGGGAREHAIIEALAAWCRGDMRAAAARLDQHTADQPHDLIALKLAHATHFMLGELRPMRAAVERALPAWDGAAPGYGYLLGCHAFALEETGELDAAERAGRAALEHEPLDAWGAHAVAHVFEMRGQLSVGVAWLDAQIPALKRCNNFAAHLFWHQALFLLELGRNDAVLALYDHEIRAEPTDDFRDISNAASILFRLESEGVDVGGRWQELADKAQARAGTDHALSFADAHYVMALGGAGRAAAAQRFIERLDRHSAANSATMHDVARTVGLPLCAGIAAYQRGEPAAALAHLAPVRRNFERLGGSHAQRDVFWRVLIQAAVQTGRIGETRRYLAERAERYLDSAYQARLLGHLDALAA